MFEPDDVLGMTAIVLAFALPVFFLYFFYRMRKLKTEERLAAIAKGVPVPFEPDRPVPARSRRTGILLFATGVGILLAFGVLSLLQPELLWGGAFALIPIAIGAGYFIDAWLAGRETRHAAGANEASGSEARLPNGS
jgi:hypothetical protein